MKCLIILRRHTIYSLLLPALFFLSLFSFSLLKSSSVNATSKTLTIDSNTDFCTIEGHNSDCSRIYIYNTKGFFDTFLDFKPNYILISSDTRFYSTAWLVYQCQVYSATSISNCYGSVPNRIMGSFFLSLNTSSDYFNTYVLSIYKSGLVSGYSYTFTFYDENPNNLPSGSLSITENGTYDVSSYAEAVVEVPNTETIVEGDYHNDLVGLKNAILIAIAVIIVFCFFKIILNMIMGVRR